MWIYVFQFRRATYAKPEMRRKCNYPPNSGKAHKKSLNLLVSCPGNINSM